MYEVFNSFRISLQDFDLLFARSSEAFSSVLPLKLLGHKLLTLYIKGKLNCD